MQSLNDRLKGEFETLREQLAEEKGKRISDSESTDSATQSELERWRALDVERNAEISRMQKEISSLQAENDQLRKQSSEQEGHERVVREERDAAQAAVTAMTRERDEARTKSDDQAREIATLYESLGALQQEVQIAPPSEPTVAETIRSLRKQLSDTQRRLQQQQQEVTQDLITEHELCATIKQGLEKTIENLQRQGTAPKTRNRFVVPEDEEERLEQELIEDDIKTTRPKRTRKPKTENELSTEQQSAEREQRHLTPSAEFTAQKARELERLQGENSRLRDQVQGLQDQINDIPRTQDDIIIETSRIRLQELLDVANTQIREWTERAYAAQQQADAANDTIK